MAVRMEDVAPVEYFKGVRRYKLLTGKNALLSVAEIDPTTSAPHPVIKHDFEEFIYMLQGEIEVEYPDTRERWIMKPGSAKYHHIGTPHTARFLGDQKILILELTSPPGHWP